MNKPIAYFLSALSALLLSSCGQDNVVILASKQVLTADSARTWQLVRLTQDGTAQAIPACLADDHITFRLNETFFYQQGAHACQPGEPVTYEGDWKLSKAQDSLTLQALIDGRFTSRKVKISRLTTREMLLQYSSGASLMVETYY